MNKSISVSVPIVDAPRLKRLASLEDAVKEAVELRVLFEILDVYLVTASFDNPFKLILGGLSGGNDCRGHDVEGESLMLNPSADVGADTYKSHDLAKERGLD